MDIFLVTDEHADALELVAQGALALLASAFLSFFVACWFLMKNPDYVWHLSTNLVPVCWLLMMTAHNIMLFGALHEDLIGKVSRHPAGFIPALSSLLCAVALAGHDIWKSETEI